MDGVLCLEVIIKWFTVLGSSTALGNDNVTVISRCLKPQRRFSGFALFFTVFHCFGHLSAARGPLWPVFCAWK